MLWNTEYCRYQHMAVSCLRLCIQPTRPLLPVSALHCLVQGLSSEIAQVALGTPLPHPDIPLSTRFSPPRSCRYPGAYGGSGKRACVRACTVARARACTLRAALWYGPLRCATDGCPFPRPHAVAHRVACGLSQIRHVSVLAVSAALALAKTLEPRTTAVVDMGQPAAVGRVQHFAWTRVPSASEWDAFPFHDSNKSHDGRSSRTGGGGCAALDAFVAEAYATAHLVPSSLIAYR